MLHESGRPSRPTTRDTPARLGPPAARALVCLCSLVLCAAGSISCGPAPGSTTVVASQYSSSSVSITTVSASASTVTVPADSGVSGSPDSSAESGRDFPGVFTYLARMLAPVPVYGLVDLPAGCALPENWWPVVDIASEDDYQGPPTDNPRIANAGGYYGEAQLVLKVGDGTAVLLQNFRGDVGLTPGEKVGQVEGHTATLYEINDGLLVQWGVEGKWYGVFARGLSADEVVALALAMERVPSEETD